MAVAEVGRRRVGPRRPALEANPPPSSHMRRGTRKPPAWPVYGTQRPTDGELWSAHYASNTRLLSAWRRLEAVCQEDRVEPEEVWTLAEWLAVAFLVTLIVCLALGLIGVALWRPA